MTATNPTLALVARVLEANYDRLLRRAEARGYRHSCFGGDDIMQVASTRFWGYAQAGKYEGLDEGGLVAALEGLVRQSGYHLWRGITADREATLRGVEIEAASGGTHEGAVAAQEVLDLAYAYYPDLRDALVAGDSVATWGKRAGLGATKAKELARESATAAYLYASGVPVADHDHRVLLAASR